MVSAASTDPVAAACIPAHRLCEGVQVRAERDGLLFYRRKGPRLYFLSSGAMLSPDYFGSGRRLPEWLSAAGIESPRVLIGLSAALEGLVHREVLRAD
jgi:putative mycofactocin binding protein MftB